MLRAAEYARYSSDNQREESIDAQLRAINDYADKNKYIVVKVYTDEALTAKTDNRPQFLQMISDAKAGLFDVIICHKLDRFARNRYDSAYYKKLLKDHGVRLVSVLENLDDSPESIILESVLEGMAEYYSANLSREVKKGFLENALDCRHNGGKPPFGYDVDFNQHYIINAQEAEALQTVFAMAATGQKNLGQWLNVNGFRNKNGKLFQSGDVSRLLKNEKYKGIYIHGQYLRQQVNGVWKNIPNPDVIRIPGGMPAIVSEELFMKANAEYSRSKRIARNNSNIVYLLSGLIECGECGYNYAGERAKARGNRAERIVYRCIGEKKEKCCKNKAVRQDYVEDLVITELDRLFAKANIDHIIKALYDEINKKAGELPGEIKHLEAQKSRLTADIDKLIDMALQTAFSDSIKKKIEQLEIEKSDVISRLEFHKLELNKLKIPSMDFLREKLTKDMGDIRSKSPVDQKKIIGAYVRKVIVYPDRIKIITDSGLRDGAEGS